VLRREPLAKSDRKRSLHITTLLTNCRSSDSLSPDFTDNSTSSKSSIGLWTPLLSHCPFQNLLSRSQVCYPYHKCLTSPHPHPDPHSTYWPPSTLPTQTKLLNQATSAINTCHHLTLIMDNHTHTQETEALVASAQTTDETAASAVNVWTIVR